MSNTIYTQLNCQFCEFTSTKIKTFRRHINVCANNPSNNHKNFKCIECNLVYLTKANLNKHITTCIHNKNKNTLTCEYCEFKTFSSSGISNHIKQCIHNPINKTLYDTKNYIKKENVESDNVFLDNKYTKLYYKIINSVTTKELNGYCENHHILPRSMGGSDDPSNIVRFSARKHFICHLLLTKMIDKKSKYYYKMIKAFMMMKANPNASNDRYINSKLYNSLKTEFAEVMSISASKNQLGSFWVHCVTTNKNIKLMKDSIIPDGHIKGKYKNSIKQQSIKLGICKYCNKEFIKTSTNNIRCNKNCTSPTEAIIYT